MGKIPKNELLELFALEVQSYLPEIKQRVTQLEKGGSFVEGIEELHRLFHNIKGAAAQVGQKKLSDGARLVEDYLEKLTTSKKSPPPGEMNKIAILPSLLEQCLATRENSSEADSFFYEELKKHFSSDPLQAVAQASKLHEEDATDNVEALRSVFPLLHELAGCLSGTASKTSQDNTIYARLSKAVSDLSVTATGFGLEKQGRLLRDFHHLLRGYSLDNVLYEAGHVELLKDFILLFETVLGQEDPENPVTVERVDNQLAKLRLLGEVPVNGDDNRESAVSDEPIPEKQDDYIAVDDFRESEAGRDEEFFGEFSGSQDLLDYEDDIDVVLKADLDEPEPISSQEDKLRDSDGDDKAEKDFFADQEHNLLLDIFKEECEEHLIVINRSLNSLETSVTQPTPLAGNIRGPVSDMRRAVHTLKGAASMTGVNLLATGAHSLEDLLDWLHDEAEEISPDDVTILAGGVDALERLAQSPEAESSPYLDRLQDAVSGYLSAHQSGDGNYDNQTETIVEDVPEESPGDIETESRDEIYQPDQATVLPADTGSLRVRLDDLDELASIEGELVVARGAMETIVSDVSKSLAELEIVKETLRKRAQELEAGFEVQALHGLHNSSQRGGGGGTTGHNENVEMLPALEMAEEELSEFDPIELDRYSELNLIIRSLNEVSVDINSIHSSLTVLMSDLGGQVSKQQLTMRLMQDKLMRIRMTPLSSISRLLYRTVRETAEKLGKNVSLTIDGEDVYMDRFVWAKITDPLMHILRNSVDHGIESPEIRRQRGKHENGQIRITAEQRSRYAVINVEDDGAGIDSERISKALVDSTSASVKDVSTLREEELLEFLFSPSFSTKRNVSEISGRGVGLDVVRSNIQDIRGTVQLHNKPGRGVRFEIQIPITLSVNRAVIVSVSGRKFAVLLQDIELVRHFADCTSDGEITYVSYNGEQVVVIDLSQILQVDVTVTHDDNGDSGLVALLLKKKEQLFAIRVDEVVEQREIIIKDLGTHLSNVQGISGVTLSGSGALIPILNLYELSEADDIAVDMAESTRTRQLVAGSKDTELKILIVDDSISVRHSIARLVESQNWQQQQAIDGVDGLAKLDSFQPDIIVLDIEMPRMNGYEFKSSVNNLESYKNIPVVMLTSRASEKHRTRARELGVDHYITKPYDEESFIEILRSCSR